MAWTVALLIAMMTVPGIWAWYVTRRNLAATNDAARRRLLRHTASVSAGIGIAILAVGVVAFVLADYNWLVLALAWAVGLLHLGLLSWTMHRSRLWTRPK